MVRPEYMTTIDGNGVLLNLNGEDFISVENKVLRTLQLLISSTKCRVYLTCRLVPDVWALIRGLPQMCSKTFFMGSDPTQRIFVSGLVPKTTFPKKRPNPSPSSFVPTPVTPT